MSSITLGDRVRCRVTGYTGIATARVEFIDGLVQILVQPRSESPDYPKGEYISEPLVELVDEGIRIEKTNKPLGFGI